MSIAGLFDHLAEVWRPFEARGLAAEVIQTLVPVHQPESGFNCAVVPPAGQHGGLRTEDIGPGETTRGRVDMYFGIGLDIEERDVIRLVAGSESPSRWFVVGVARPRNHHIEATVEPWVGKFPDEDES